MIKKQGYLLISLIFLFFSFSAIEAKDNHSFSSDEISFFSSEKEKCFSELTKEGKKLPDTALGMSDTDFDAAEGDIGFVPANIMLDMKENPYMEIPIKGKRVRLVFTQLKVVDNKSVCLTGNLPSDSNGYLITAYRLLTCFPDESKQFYQLYYQVKHEGSNVLASALKAAAEPLRKGIEYSNQGKYDEAITEFDKAISICPRSVSFEFRGVAYLKKGDYDQAIYDFSKAIEMDSSNRIAYYNRGVAYYAKNNYKKSREDVQKAISLGYTVDQSFLDELKKASDGDK